ncbi:MAG TPA: Crp/Fnr family transcriptional regulator [Solirubrobacteraceae bacterium]|nr:Crp/Fnr family transcriptional regulator [Solirubrobacteraceae bacterium]
MTPLRDELGVCWVLREDPELAEAVDPDQRERAADALVARELVVAPGPWARGEISLDGGIGLLVLDGVLLHRVGIGERFGAELIGSGDVLRRPYPETAASPLPLHHQWSILQPTRIAVLDGRFSRQLAGFPAVAGRLFSRSVARSRQLAVNMAIVQQARVDARLHLLLWHLAGRWGRVRTDGVLVPLRLTHSVLADMVAARRPTVTTALTLLREQGLVRATEEGWLLCGDAPGHGDGP